MALASLDLLERRLVFPISNFLRVYSCVFSVFLLLNLHLCCQGDDGEVGDPGPVGKLGVIVSQTASISSSQHLFVLFLFCWFFSLLVNVFAPLLGG